MHLLRLLPRFRRAYREMEILAARESWSRAEIEAWQLERLNVVWAHASAAVPYYRRLTAEHRLPGRFASLEEFRARMPVLSRAEVKHCADQLLSDRPARGEWHVSSGSTGTPTRFYWGHEDHQALLRCNYRMRAMWGADIFDPTAFLWGNGALHEPGLYGVVARLRRRLEDFLRNRLRLSAYFLAPADLREHLSRLAAFRPAVLYAYSTAAYLLAREAEARSFHCDALKFCILSAEPTTPHLIKTVERAFGVPALIEYGATECPLIAGEATDRTLRVREDMVFVETRPVDDQHEIILTLLCNKSFPLLRYAIGDRTETPLEVPARGFAILKNITGRENDFLLTRTGRILHPLRFDFLFGFGWAENVRRYRIHQHSDGSVDVAVEVSKPVAAPEVCRLKSELERLLEGYPITLEVVPSFTQSARKHRWIFSDLKPSFPPG